VSTPHDGSEAGVGTVARRSRHITKSYYMENACHIRVHSVSLQRHPSLYCTASFIYRPLTLFPLTFPLLCLLPLSVPFYCLSLFLSLSITHSIISPLLCIAPQLPLPQTFWSLSQTLPWHNAGIISGLMEVAIFCRGGITMAMSSIHHCSALPFLSASVPPLFPCLGSLVDSASSPSLLLQ